MTMAIVRRTWPWLGLIVAFGLALRIAGAQGALWLDEAWSAKLAHDAGTPIGVFLNINHDNNHHLNSLWLQFVGTSAPPVLARALSIVTGTLAILAAALIARPQGRIAMLSTAWLFAISPILVTLGSEARGYAPMSLALLTAVGLVERQLAGSVFRPQRALALCLFLGALSQLTMVFGVCAIVGWYIFAMWRDNGWRHAVKATLRLFAVPLVALAFALALVFVPALLSPTGFQFGRYDPFDMLQYLHGVVEMIGYTVALPIGGEWLIAGALILVVLAGAAGTSKLGFYRLAIFGFPLMLALLHSGNVAHPRYYLIAGVALLLLLGELVAVGWQRGGGWRWAGAAGLLAFSIAALVLDVDLIRNQRGDPGTAVHTMRARAPGAATLILDRSTGYAMIEQSAVRERYPVTIQEAGCPSQRFLLADRFHGESFPAQILRCGARYVPIDGRRARGLSGTHWTLYERRP
jgi:hypothetical protein